MSRYKLSYELNSYVIAIRISHDLETQYRFAHRAI